MSSDLQTIESLLTQIRAIVLGARKSIAQNVNSVQVITCFRIGHLIVEHEQQGETRAPYGKETLNQLSKRLVAEFGRGFSSTNLKVMRQFYLLKKPPIGQTVSDQLVVDDGRGIIGVLSSAPNSLIGSMGALSFSLSWSHYVLLLGIKQEEERRFYELEAVQQHWSVRELKRQFNTSLYERLALSRDKAEVARLAQQGQLVEKPSDLLKEPYVLEFLGLEERNQYSESDLETAIIDKLEHFLLELGKGFLFEARQKRFTFAEDHFFIDLVFYNRLLRCYNYSGSHSVRSFRLIQKTLSPCRGVPLRRWSSRRRGDREGTPLRNLGIYFLEWPYLMPLCLTALYAANMRSRAHACSTRGGG